VPNHQLSLVFRSLPTQAGMAELADAADSKSADLRVLGVQLPLPAPNIFSFAFNDLPQLISR
jgi:hypothetical protein